MKISCIILASGYGRRFGGNKLLAHIGNKRLIDYTIEATPKSLIPNTVIVSQYKCILDLANKNGFKTIYNSMKDDGINESIRLGMSAIDIDSDACMFRVCDQPYLTKSSIKLLINTYKKQPNKIIALGYNGKRGNPVIFPKKYFNELSTLANNNGGGKVIKDNISQLYILEIADKKELFDIDTLDKCL